MFTQVYTSLKIFIKIGLESGMVVHDFNPNRKRKADL